MYTRKDVYYLCNLCVIRVFLMYFFYLYYSKKNQTCNGFVKNNFGGVEFYGIMWYNCVYSCEINRVLRQRSKWMNSNKNKSMVYFLPIRCLIFALIFVIGAVITRQKVENISNWWSIQPVL